MKSSYPRLRSIRPTRCNPILTVTTIREIAEHNGAAVVEHFRDERGFGVRLRYLFRAYRGPAIIRARRIADVHPAVIDAHRANWRKIAPSYSTAPLPEGVIPPPWVYEELVGRA